MDLPLRAYHKLSRAQSIMNIKNSSSPPTATQYPPPLMQDISVLFTFQWLYAN